jgi:hypothetical protein
LTTSSLEHQLDRLEAYVEIANLLGRYKLLHAAGRMMESAELFAKRDDTLSQTVWGYHRGWESVRRFYAHMATLDSPDSPEYPPGRMYEYPLTTPCIEVAEDGRTAKAVWWCPGHETMFFPDGEHGTRRRAQWAFIRYANDLIRMPDEKWYLWHHFIFLSVLAEYREGWRSGGALPPEMDLTDKPAGMEEDGPAFIKEDPYDPSAASRSYLPAAPEPFAHYSGDMAWIRPR